ncbi:predicted protein [Streptomyces albidoflavus]|nr:predicted protein [Streptomyces albidoflavus]
MGARLTPGARAGFYEVGGAAGRKSGAGPLLRGASAGGGGGTGPGTADWAAGFAVGT